MTKEQLIRLIHIAKGQLKIDDETYRAKLEALTGKTSCADMTIGMLNAVYQSFKDAGFKRKFNKKTGGARVNPNARGESKAAEIPVIRAVWTTMHAQGFVKNGAEASLNGYVQRMTARLNGGAGVAEVGWLDGRLAAQVLETLKNWHLRLIRNEFKTRRIPAPVDHLGAELRGYDALAGVYARVVKHDAYLAGHREAGSHMLDMSCPGCGFRSAVVAPTDRSEKWDTTCVCPACSRMSRRVITCHAVYNRGGAR